MLGPLPFLHRAVLVTAVLLTAIAAGAWVAHFTPLPVAIGVGAVVGGARRLLVGVRDRARRRPAPGPRATAVTSDMTELNVLGDPLRTCGTEPLTGYYRDGDCRCGPEDQGLHAVCAVMTEEFLTHQRSVGNDLVTPRPEWSFPDSCRATGGASSRCAGCRPPRTGRPRPSCWPRRTCAPSSWSRSTCCAQYSVDVPADVRALED